MAESLLITGQIGSDVHAITCDAVGGTGSPPVLGWIVSLTGVYDYDALKANLAVFTRLFGARQEVLLYEGALTPTLRPVIDHVEPRHMPAGGADVTLHVYGHAFTPRSQIVFNGGLETTVFVGPTELTTVVTGATATTPGEYAVEVETAAPGGGRSGARLFAILEP